MPQLRYRPNRGAAMSAKDSSLVLFGAAEVGLAEGIVGGGATAVGRMGAWSDALEVWMDNLRGENTRRADGAGGGDRWGRADAGGPDARLVRCLRSLDG